MFSWSRRTDRAPVVDPVAGWPHGPLELLDTEFMDGESSVDTDQASDSLRLLSFNIQVGIRTDAYRQYFTKGWKHVLPHGARRRNLAEIARLISSYDLVGLQEIDGGSLRSGFINQVEYLAEEAGFPYWYTQLNRDLGPIAQHGNGLLTRVQPEGLEDHKLPGAIPGRGAVFLRMPFAGNDLVVVMLHLSLGERSRRRQLAYIAECLADEQNVVLMGDMNSSVSNLLEGSPLQELSLVPAHAGTPTYPAWRPALALDHVLVSPSLEVRDFKVLNCRVSDHLPVSVELAAA